MKPSDAATYERARRLANLALWTVQMQRRRLNSEEPEDKEFVFRTWSDFQFLIVALTRLRRAAVLAAKIAPIKGRMRHALSTFDTALPHLKTMRDVAEHIDDYSVDAGHNRGISRKSLEVASSDGETWNWLDSSINANEAMSASIQLFSALKDCASTVKKARVQTP